MSPVKVDFVSFNPLTIRDSSINGCLDGYDYVNFYAKYVKKQ